jgi:Tol biopolymer transport system component
MIAYADSTTGILIAKTNGSRTPGRILYRQKMNRTTANPDWSPDGTRIVFEEGRLLNYQPSGFQILTIKTDGTDLRELTRSDSFRNPAWSPDGRKIAFLSRDGVHIMNADGTNETTIVADPSVGVALAWSPHGRRLAFSVLRAKGSPAAHWWIFTVSVKGNDRRPVSPANGVRGLSWG